MNFSLKQLHPVLTTCLFLGGQVFATVADKANVDRLASQGMIFCRGAFQFVGLHAGAVW